MRATFFIAIVGALAVLALDTVGSIVSLRTGFSYASLAPASFAIYALVGVAAGLKHRKFLEAAIASALVGLVDSSLGWYISWQIGPGRAPGLALSPAVLVVSACLVVIGAALTGLIAYAIVSWSSRPKQTPVS